VRTPTACAGGGGGGGGVGGGGGPAGGGGGGGGSGGGGGGGGGLCGRPTRVGRETCSFPRFTLRGRPLAVHVQRYRRPRTSRTVSVACLRGFTNGLRRPAIEKILGRFPRFEIRNCVRPGRAVRATLQARSVIVTATRAGCAVPEASATPGQASTQSATAARAAGEIRSISPSSSAPSWSEETPVRGRFLPVSSRISSVPAAWSLAPPRTPGVGERWRSSASRSSW
jgi:hypothetical protein